MNSLTRNNKKNIYEQNYSHFLKLNKNKKFKKNERERIKSKIHNKAQCQLSFDILRCKINYFNEEDVKLSELHKIYDKRGSSIIEIDDTETGTISIHKQVNNTENSSNIVDILVDNQEGINKENIEVIESTSSRQNSNKNHTANNPEQNDREIIDDDYNDFVELVDAVRTENETNDIKDENSQLPKLELQNNNDDKTPNSVRRTNRTTKPVLYSENLSHIQFIGSPRYCSTTNCTKNSNSASSKKSDGSRKRKRNNSPNVPQTVQIPSTPITSRTEYINIDNKDNYNQHNNYIKIKPLPKGGKNNQLEIKIAKNCIKIFNEQPVHITIGLNDLNLYENQETAAAVASISCDIPSTSMEPPITKKPKEKAKRIRKPCCRKKTKLSVTESKCDLRTYIETFGDGTIPDDRMELNYTYENQLQEQQNPYQSPQNAGVSTTTGEWIPQNSSAIQLNELLNSTNQLEVELDNPLPFNLISYVEDENNILSTNTVPQNNIYQMSTNSASQNIAILKATSPGDISSTTDLTNHMLRRSCTGDLTYDINLNSMYLQQAASQVQQPVVKNHYERATMDGHFHSSPIEFQLINSSLQPAHQSTNMSHQNNQNGPVLNALDLSKKHTLIDLEARFTKQELITHNTTYINQNSPNLRIISLEEYKRRVPDRQLYKAPVRGLDMPSLLVDDENYTAVDNNDKINDIEASNDIELSLNSNTNANKKVNLLSNSNQTSETCNIQRNIDVIDAQIVVQIPENAKPNDTNISDEIFVTNINTVDLDKNNENIKQILNNIDEKSVELSETTKTNNSTCVEDTENKSNNEIDISQCIDDFLSMKDNTILDYEQDLEDCLSINVSPCYAFDLDDEEPNNILQKSPQNEKINDKNELTTPTKSVELKNTTETLDIFGIIHTNPTDKVKESQVKTSIINCNNHSDKQIKDFKIPKLINNLKQDNNNISSITITNSTDKIALNRTSVLDYSETPVLRCWPNNPTNILKPQPIKHDLHPRISMSSATQLTTLSESLNNVGHSENRYRNISHIFGSPCFNYLKDNCTKAICRFKHYLPDPGNLKTTLLELNDQYIEKAFYETTKYNFFFFNKYFDMFFEIYCEKKNEHMLKEMISQCQIFIKCYEFLARIRDGLIKFGKSKLETVQIIIDNWNSNSTNSINRIVELIIDADPTKFLSILKHYSKLSNYRYEAESINRMVAIYNQTKHYDLMQILVIIVDNIPKEDLSQVNKYVDIMTFLETVKDIDKNSHPNYIHQMNCITPASIFNPPHQRTINRDNLTMMLNQQLLPEHQNLFTM